VLRSILAFIAAIRAFFRSRSDTALEVLALRQQVAVLKRQHRRPRLNSLDRLFWTTLRRYWPRWSDVLLIVKPATVVGWHRGGFRLYWRWRSRPCGGRPATTAEIRTHIRTMASENSGWAPPRSMENYSSSASKSRNGLSPDICDGFAAVAIQAGSGCPFSRIIAR